MSVLAVRGGNVRLIDDGDGMGHVESGQGAGPSVPVDAILKWGYWRPVDESVTAAAEVLPGEGPLIRKYEQVLRRNAKRCAENFRRSSRVITAAGQEQNRNPQLDEVLNEGQLQESAKSTDTARKKIAEDAARAAALDLVVSWSLVNPYLESLVKAQAGRQAERLVAGVRDVVASTILESLTQGWDVDETARQIQEDLVTAAKWQAKMLARTDLIAMSNGGSFAAAQALAESKPVFKVWKNADDARVRPTHVEAEDQTVPLDQPFVVGGSALAFPGDPNGPDGEVINCRCTLVYTDDPKSLISAAWREEDHPRDPGGEDGGEFISKGAVEGTSEGGEFRAKNEYEGVHDAPDRSSGAPMHDLANAETGVFPADIYGSDAAQYYQHFPEFDEESLAAIRRAQGRPTEPITIYRAVPAAHPEINPGDWVTPSRSYAEQHALYGDDMTVVSKVVPAGQLYSDANSIHEFGWDPPFEQGRFPTLESVRDANPKAGLEVHESSGGIKLDQIRVHPDERGQGLASKALDDVLEFADNRGLPVALDIGHDELDEKMFGGLSEAKKEKWYRSRGFVPNRGRNKDFAFTQGWIRPARAVSAAAVGYTGDGGMIALYPSPDQAQALERDAGQPREELHVTLCFFPGGVPAEAFEFCQEIAQRFPPLEGNISGVGEFLEGEDGTPVVAFPSVVGLTELRELIAANVEGYSDRYGFIPHMTLGYGGVEDREAVLGQPVTFPALSVVDSTGRVDFPLDGSE